MSGESVELKSVNIGVPAKPAEGDVVRLVYRDCNWEREPRGTAFALKLDELAAENAALRRSLFQKHWAPVDYTDDGEMQCHATHPPTDFKRDPLEKLEVACLVRIRERQEKFAVLRDMADCDAEIRNLKNVPRAERTWQHQIDLGKVCRKRAGAMKLWQAMKGSK